MDNWGSEIVAAVWQESMFGCLDDLGTHWWKWIPLRPCEKGKWSFWSWSCWTMVNLWSSTKKKTTLAGYGCTLYVCFLFVSSKTFKESTNYPDSKNQPTIQTWLHSSLFYKKISCWNHQRIVIHHTSPTHKKKVFTFPWSTLPKTQPGHQYSLAISKSNNCTRVLQNSKVVCLAGGSAASAASAVGDVEDHGMGWQNPSEKYEFVSWDDEIPNIWENNPVMFQSPPTSIWYFDIELIGLKMESITLLGEHDHEPINLSFRTNGARPLHCSQRPQRLSPGEHSSWAELVTAKGSESPV